MRLALDFSKCPQPTRPRDQCCIHFLFLLLLLLFKDAVVALAQEACFLACLDVRALPNISRASRPHCPMGVTALPSLSAPHGTRARPSRGLTTWRRWRTSQGSRSSPTFKVWGSSSRRTGGAKAGWLQNRSRVRLSACPVVQGGFGAARAALAAALGGGVRSGATCALGSLCAPARRGGGPALCGA